MKFKVEINGISPYCESGNDVDITTLFDLHRISLQYGVPITLEFDQNIISIDLEDDS